MLPSKIWSLFLLSLTGIMFLENSESLKNARIIAKKPSSASAATVKVNADSKSPYITNELSKRPPTMSNRNGFSECVDALFRAGLLRGSSQRSASGLSILGDLLRSIILNISKMARLDENVLSQLPPITRPIKACIPSLPPANDEEGSASRPPADASNKIEGIPKDLLLVSFLISELSYRDEDTIDRDTRPEIFEILGRQADGFPIFIQGDRPFDTKAYVWHLRDTRTLLISFRGTHSVIDIKFDLDARLIKLDDSHSDIMVHAGFRNKLKSIEKQIRAILEEYNASYDKVIFTGHSLGGSLATLAAPLFGEEYPTKSIECLTFGTPRVGDAKFVEWFNAKVDSNFRIINEGDRVAALPIQKSFLHVSDALSFSRSGRVSKVSDVPPGRRLWRALENFDLESSLREHRLDTYQERLKAYIADPD